MAKNYPDAVIIAADTFVVYGDSLLGKPHTPEKAKEMLQMLNGKPHTIITGFTIIDTKNGESVSEAIGTVLYLKELSEQEIDDYIATGEPLDKAGAYGIQGRGKHLVDRIEGDHDTVIGLPVVAVLEVLKRFK